MSASTEPHSYRAAEFAPAAEPPPEPELPPIPTGTRQLELVMPEPLHLELDYRRLWRVIERLRGDGYEGRLRLWISTAHDDPAAYEELPVDEVVRSGRGDVTFPDREALRAGGPAVLVHYAALTQRKRLRRAAALEPIGSLALGGWFPADTEACRAAAARFHAALRGASPTWRTSSDHRIALAGARPRVLVHQPRRHVGDTLWLTPFLAELKRLYPGAEVTLVGPRLMRWVLTGNPHVERILLDTPGASSRRRLLARLSELGPFDVAFLSFARERSEEWVASFAAEHSAHRINLEYFWPGFDAARSDPRFTHEGWFFWGTRRNADMLVAGLEPLANGEPPVAGRAEYYVSPEARAWARLALSVRGIGAREPFVVLTPGGYSSTRWPERRFARLARRLADELGLHVLVEGSPEEASLVRRIAERANDGRRSSPRIVACDDPFDVLAALLERARLLVSNDTGTIHLAEALATPTLYFAMLEKLVHSHPLGDACWAIYDERAGVRGIRVAQAMGAVGRMEAAGLVRLG